MDDASLPEELGSLERRLAGLSRAEPPSDLRGRVLAAVEHERSRFEGASSGLSDWRWVLAGAAAVLLWLNFSMSVVNNLDWHFGGELERGDVEQTVRQMKQLVPDLPEREAFRQALLLRAGSQVTAAPYFQASLDQVLKQRERESWDMR
jgi:hypothetical protein